MMSLKDTDDPSVLLLGTPVPQSPHTHYEHEQAQDQQHNLPCRELNLIQVHYRIHK